MEYRPCSICNREEKMMLRYPKWYVQFVLKLNMG